MAFISRFFSFSNYSRVLKFASKHSCSRPFPWVEDRYSLYFVRKTTICNAYNSAHVVCQLKLELYSPFWPNKETITQFVTHSDSHWTASESIIRYSMTLN